MGVPDDANPLNRRLPAEVITRQRKPEKKKQAEKEDVPTDRTIVLALTPDQRMKWLSKALLKCQEGKMTNTIIYDIVTNKNFTTDVVEKIGVKMFRAVRANLPLFSQKQQRFLQDDECRLFQLFSHIPEKHRAAAAAAAAAKGGEGSTAEAIEERIREFARKKQQERAAAAFGAGTADDEDDEEDEPRVQLPPGGIAELWENLCRLPPMERAMGVGRLDAATKELLEEFLEARIARAAATASSSAASGGREGGASASTAVPAPAARSPNGEASTDGKSEAAAVATAATVAERSPSRSRSRSGSGRGRGSKRSRKSEEEAASSRSKSRSSSGESKAKKSKDKEALDVLIKGARLVYQDRSKAVKDRDKGHDETKRHKESKSKKAKDVGGKHGRRGRHRDRSSKSGSGDESSRSGSKVARSRSRSHKGRRK